MRPILNTAIKVARQTATQLVRSYDQLGCAVEKELQAEMTQRIQTQCFEEMQQAIQDARPLAGFVRICAAFACATSTPVYAI